MAKRSTQEILDSIPTPIKNLLRRSLYISIGSLKEEQRENWEADKSVDDLIESFTYIHDKLGKR
jgi:hypothetical protein